VKKRKSDEKTAVINLVNH